MSRQLGMQPKRPDMSAQVAAQQVQAEAVNRQTAELERQEREAEAARRARRGGLAGRLSLLSDEVGIVDAADASDLQRRLGA